MGLVISILVIWITNAKKYLHIKGKDKLYKSNL